MQDDTIAYPERSIWEVGQEGEEVNGRLPIKSVSNGQNAQLSGPGNHLHPGMGIKFAIVSSHRSASRRRNSATSNSPESNDAQPYPVLSLGLARTNSSGNAFTQPNQATDL